MLATTVAQMKQLYAAKKDAIEHTIEFSANSYEVCCAKLVKEIATSQ